jgi:hypothetical protein
MVQGFLQAARFKEVHGNIDWEFPTGDCLPEWGSFMHVRPDTTEDLMTLLAPAGNLWLLLVSTRVDDGPFNYLSVIDKQQRIAGLILASVNDSLENFRRIGSFSCSSLCFWEPKFTAQDWNDFSEGFKPRSIVIE